ncbi:PBECR2 nuclease fold domain-containing protein [Campylobacter felis]|uniref:PBECR2 nuclease fold domain-containing protein n=1 Tax=Campylobacter felis TaxID=2974565 RepID=UPI00256205D1|nr:PBECR2 nuclease fold domain-containing protein [Campylobacter felis]
MQNLEDFNAEKEAKLARIREEELKWQEEIYKRQEANNLKDILEAEESPLKEDFGVNFVGFKGKEAVLKLLEEKRGQVKNAFYKEGLGDIDLVWGDENFGLKHILTKHGGEFENLAKELSEAVENGKIVKDDKGRLRLEYENKIVGIKDNWKGEKTAHWVVTAYVKKEKEVSLYTSTSFTKGEALPLNSKESIAQKGLSADEAISILQSIEAKQVPKELDIEGFLKELESVENKENFITHLSKKEDAQSRLAYLNLVKPTLEEADLILKTKNKFDEPTKEFIKAFQDENKRFFYIVIAEQDNEKKLLTAFKTNKLRELKNRIEKARDFGEISSAHRFIESPTAENILKQKSLNLTENIYLKDNDTPLKVEYAVVKKEDLKPTFTLSKTQYRSEKQEELIEKIKNEFNSDLLVNIRGDLKNGNPIVTQNGEVLSGNHRVAALKELEGENLSKYQKAVKEAFGVELKENEMLVRVVSDDTSEAEIKRFAAASNEGLENNLGEQGVSLFAKYQDKIKALKMAKRPFVADDVYNLKYLVNKALGETSITKENDTSKALFASLARGRNNTILKALNELEKENLEQVSKVANMFFDNAGAFYNLTHDLDLPKMQNLQNYFSDVLVSAAKADYTRAEDFTKLNEDIRAFLDSADKEAMLKLSPNLVSDLLTKAMGAGFARFARLENPSASLFDFLNGLKEELIEKGAPDLFSGGKGVKLNERDEFDFAKELILKGQDSNEKFKLYGNLEELKAWRKESKTKLDKARVNLSKIDEGGLSEEQKELLKLFKGEIKSVKIQVKDLKDIYTLKQGSAKVGAKKILIKHYGEEKTGGLSDEELLGIKEVIKKGEINLNSLEIKGDILRYGYDYEKDGVKLRVVVDEFKEGKKIFDYYSDRNFNHYEQGGYKPNLPTPSESIAENAEEKQKLLTFHTKKLLEYKGDLNAPLNAESELKTRDILDYIKKADLSPKEAVFLIHNAKDEAQILKRQILEAAQKWLETFGLKSLNDEVSVEIPQVVKEKLGKELILNQKDFKKIVEKGREKYILQIKETFNEPEAVFIDENGDLIFAKSIDDKLFFVNVNRDYGETFKALSLAPKKNNNLLRKLDKAKEILKLDSKLRDSTAQQAFTGVLSAPNKSNAESIAQKNDILSEVVDNYERFCQRYGGSLDGSLYLDDFKALNKDEQREFSHILYTFRNYLNQYDKSFENATDSIKKAYELDILGQKEADDILKKAKPQRNITKYVENALRVIKSIKASKEYGGDYFEKLQELKDIENKFYKYITGLEKTKNQIENIQFQIQKANLEKSPSYEETRAKTQTLSSGYEPSANSFVKPDEIIPQKRQNQALKTTTREIEKFMQLAQDLQNKSLSKNDKIQIIDNLVSALSSLEHKMPEFIEEIMKKANKATMPYASSVDRAKYKGFNASDKYAMLEAFRVIKLLDAYDDAEKLIEGIKKGKDIDFNNKIFKKMQNTEKALVLSQTQASLGVRNDFEKVLKNHEEDVNLLIDKALKLLGDKKTQNAGAGGESVAEIERDLTRLKEAGGREDIFFLDTKGRERTLTKETQKAWLETFGLKSLDEEFIPNLPHKLKEALGKEIKLTKGSLYKIVEKGREKYIPQIKQTLQNPDFALRDRDNMLILAKQIGDKQYFTSINLETKDYFISVSNAPKKENILKNKVENGAKILYQSPNAKSIFYTDTLLQTDKSSANKIDEDIIAQKPQEIIKKAKEKGESISSTPFTKGDNLSLNSNESIAQKANLEAVNKQKDKEFLEAYEKADFKGKCELVKEDINEEIKALEKQKEEFKRIIQQKDYHDIELEQARKILDNAKEEVEGHYRIKYMQDGKEMGFFLSKYDYSKRALRTKDEILHEIIRRTMYGDKIIKVEKTIDRLKKQIKIIDEYLKEYGDNEAGAISDDIIEKFKYYNFAKDTPEGGIIIGERQKTLYEQAQKVLKSRFLKMKGRAQKSSRDYNITYDEARKLFYKGDMSEEQKALFESVLPIAQKLNVRIRTAIREPYEDMMQSTKDASGLYRYSLNTATLKKGAGLSDTQKAQVLLHELIHSVTSRAMSLHKTPLRDKMLSKTQIRAIDEIEQIYKKLYKFRKTFKLQDENGEPLYGLTNMHEMLAELANPMFSSKLKEIGLYEKVINNIMKIILSVRDFIRLRSDKNVYEKLKQCLKDIIENYKDDFTQEYEKQNIRDFTLTSQTQKEQIYTQRQEIKNTLKAKINQAITNESTGEKAILTNKGISKMLSDKAISKSLDNGFSREEHLRAVEVVDELFKRAKKALSKIDEKDKNLSIYRYNAPFENANALMTLKEYKQNGKRIYSLELESLEAAKFNPSGKDLAEQLSKSKDADTTTFHTPIDNPSESIAQNANVGIKASKKKSMN